VLGINLDPLQIEKCEEFRDVLGIEPERCQFKLHDIYDVLLLGHRFDQIICFETLEHLKRDAEVLSLFHKILEPKGLLHLCTPRRNRKSYYGEVLSETEDGGHVRLGYELSDIETLLAAQGFAVKTTDTAIGFFSLRVEEILNWFESAALKSFPEDMRELLQTAVFLCLYPITFLDPFFSTYLCLYVQAISLERD
jgi:cyclopropane fatty-acyl-phospholipid synthase-like methyltransferase